MVTDQQKIARLEEKVARLEALLGSLLPIVEPHPIAPQVRTLVWRDGVRVTYQGERCIGYNAPVPSPDPWKVRIAEGRKFLELSAMLSEGGRPQSGPPCCAAVDGKGTL